MTGAKPKKESADNGLKILIKENALLKSKIAYSLGSLETLSYLLKNDDPETNKDKQLYSLDLVALVAGSR
jgi:hypothetical protein